MPGDGAFLLAGAVLLVDLLRKLPFRRKATVGEGEELRLAPFTVERAPTQPVRR